MKEEERGNDGGHKNAWKENEMEWKDIGWTHNKMNE
jgi:hypothetical protein